MYVLSLSLLGFCQITIKNWLLNTVPISGEAVATAVSLPVRVRWLVRADVPRPADVVHGAPQLRPHHRRHVDGESPIIQRPYYLLQA